MALVSILCVGLGVAVGYRLYSTWREREPLLALGPLHRVLANKYYMDDFYMKYIVKPIQLQLSSAVNVFNTKVLDGIVHSFAYAARGLARLVEVFDRRAVDGAVNGIAQAAGTTGGMLKYLQSGNIQRYAVSLFVGVAILAVLILKVQ